MRESIYVWSVPMLAGASDQGNIHTVTLFADGALKCTCHDWVFPTGKVPRGCTHTRQVQPEVQIILGKLGLFPKVSPEITAAANELLMVPNFMRGVNQQMQEVSRLMNAIADDMEAMVKRLIPPTPAPGIFFLNEAHETHTTKSQARRERRDAKLAKEAADAKPASKRKLAVGPLAPRKRRTIGTVHR